MTRVLGWVTAGSLGACLATTVIYLTSSGECPPSLSRLVGLDAVIPIISDITDPGQLLCSAKTAPPQAQLIALQALERAHAMQQVGETQSVALNREVIASYEHALRHHATLSSLLGLANAQFREGRSDSSRESMQRALDLFRVLTVVSEPMGSFGSGGVDEEVLYGIEKAIACLTNALDQTNTPLCSEVYNPFLPQAQREAQARAYIYGLEAGEH